MDLFKYKNSKHAKLHPLLGMRRCIVQKPDALDEITERASWGMADVMHDNVRCQKTQSGSTHRDRSAKAAAVYLPRFNPTKAIVDRKV
jgi:hypothetical protein